MSHNWKTGIAVQLVYIQTRRVICRVNIVSSSFFFPEEIPFVFVVRLKCWWFHQGIRISNQNKTCKILHNNKKISYWKLHTKAVESRSRLTYVSQKKDVTSLAINWTLGATRRIFSPFYQTFSFLFGDVVAFYELLPRRISLFGPPVSRAEIWNIHFKKKQKKLKSFVERETNEKQISSPIEKNKNKNKRGSGSKCNKKQLWMLYILWSDVYYKTNLDNTRQLSDIYQ